MTDKEARFSKIVNQYSEQLYWKARQIVVRHEDADDVVQNAFLKAWARFDDFRGDANIYTWIYRITVNEAIDFLRRKHEQVSPDGEMRVADNQFADDYFDGNETQKLLYEAMETLPEAQRATFSLRYFDDMPYSEISKILGTTEGGLKANYHLAVKKIKDFFQRKN